MKARLLVVCCFFFAAAACAHADSVSYAQCGTYDSYLLLYKTTERFEELGKLRCGEKVEIISRSGSYSQIRTIDGRYGWVRAADLSDAPPPPQRVFTFGLSEAPKTVQPVAVPKPPASALTNDDILAMHALHRGSDFILKQIASSRCAFDTTPQAILRLSSADVSDKVILAVLQAPVATDAPERRTSESVDVKIPDGTSFEVELTGNVSSEEVQAGTVVEMVAAEDLVVDGVPVVVRGSVARARVLAFRPPGPHGGSGVVAWFMQDIVATNGDRIPVNFAAKQPGNDRTRNFEGYPYFLSGFHKDNPAIKAADRRFRVVVHGDTVLSVSQSLTAAVPASKQKAQSVRQVSAQSAIQPEAVPPPQPAVATEAKP
jgi:hypothetical protein